jgi:WD40 repeat protein/tRNA A-37 threonylcarbamoyl transferase component Bud32
VSRKITDSSHLAAEQLRAFQAGTLQEEHLAEVEAHLQSCVACCDVLSGLPEDNFLLRVRCACANPPTLLLQKRPSSTPPPQDTVSLPETPLETTASVTPPLPGYEKVRELGRGGMGVVYAATHAVMGRRVAIKVIHPEFSSNPVAVERFRREVLAAARLSHPNIVTAYDAGEDGGRSFLVMERIAGESLGDRLDRLGPLPVAEACDAVRQAALGVQHAHDHGLIHRDLKPHNLMRTADGTVKVCDFGLAALLNDRRPASRATAPNAIMGTPDYMAPEQAEDARSADGRADVYALGCTLYHLLTGQVPFPEESVLLKLVAHRTRTRPSALRLRPEIPAELDDVLRRSMARKPANRYQTPGDLAKALEPFADPAYCSPRRHGRKRLLALAAFVLSLAFAIVGVVRLPTGKDQDVVIQTDAPEVEPERPGEVLRWSQGYKAIRRIAFSPDGRSFWTAGDDFSKWDLRTGKRLEQIGARNFAEESLLSPDGKMLLLAEPGGRGAQLYDAATLKPLRSLLGSPSRLMQAVWLPDGRLLTGGNDFIARLWDAQTGKVIREFRGHTANIDYVDVNRDGTRVLTFSCGERTVRIWDLDDGKELWSVSGQMGLALFAPDGKSILIGGRDGVIRRLAYPSGTILRSFRSPGRQLIDWDRLCLMADGRHFLAAGSDRALRLWDLETGRERYRADHPGLAVAIAASPDGRYALLGTDFGSVLKWRLPPLRQGREEITEQAGHGEEVGEVRIMGGGVGRIGRVRFLPDGERVLVSSDSLSLWNTRTGEKIREFAGPFRGWSHAVNISRNGRYALVGFHLVDLKTGEKVHTLEGGEDSGIPLWGVAFSPDGSRAVLGGEAGRRTGTLWVADLKTGKPWKICDTEQRVRAVAYSPDGTCIAASHVRSGAPSTLRVYKVETGEILHSFKVPNDAGCIAFSPDGNQLVSAHDKTLYLWDLKMETALKRFEGHTGFIEDVVFTPDGQRIVSAAWDATVRVWNLSRGEEVACFRGHIEGILGVSVSADGLHAVSGAGDRTLRLWRLPKPKSGSGLSPTSPAALE